VPQADASNVPYVSVAFVNRNDGYGGDLEGRIAKFIEYYGHFARRWPGLFEFVITDWNPPADRPSLQSAFRWQELGDVTHVVVPPDVHARVAGTRGRKMLDYFGRNVSIRRSRGVFTLVVNQDIFIGASILEEIARRGLSHRHFYRADPCRNASPEAFEACAAANVIELHRRHNSAGLPIDLKVRPGEVEPAPSGCEAGDRRLEGGDIIDCTGDGRVRWNDAKRLWRWRLLSWQRKELEDWYRDFVSEKYYRQFFLHTNGAGDFLLAPRAAFERIHGMPETTDFYLHLDSYAVVQLHAAGLRQAIFTGRHRVYHADHDRSARADFVEGISWHEHEIRLSNIARRAASFRLNGPSWGLGDENLPTTRG
jgi:hypothetical protein